MSILEKWSGTVIHLPWSFFSALKNVANALPCAERRGEHIQSGH